MEDFEAEDIINRISKYIPDSREVIVLNHKHDFGNEPVKTFVTEIEGTKVRGMDGGTNHYEFDLTDEDDLQLIEEIYVEPVSKYKIYPNDDIPF